MKKTLALLLALLMLLTMVPMALAEQELKTVNILCAYPTGSIAPEEARKMPIWKDYEAFFAERGLKIEMEYVDTDQYSTVLQARIAANNMPDLFAVNSLSPATLLQLAETGKIFAIDDILENSDGTAEFALSKEGYMWPVREKNTFEDGKLYYLSQASMLSSVISEHDNFGYHACTGNTYGMKVRQDWLDKIGMAVPTTLDEFFDMLVAFQENDVNGNGLKDERMVISVNTCDADNGGFFDNGVASWFGLASYVFQLDRVNWEAKVPFLQEGFVPYVEFLKKCIDAGVLYLSDGVTKKTDSNVSSLMAQDVIAAYMWRANSEAAGAPEGAVYTNLGKIVGVEGIEPVMSASRGWKGWDLYGFRAGMDPEAAAAMLDAICSIEWSILFNYGIEGKSYIVTENGSYKNIAPTDLDAAKEHGYTTGYNLIGDGRIPRTAMDAYYQTFNGEKLIWNTYDDFFNSSYFEVYYGPATIDTYGEHGITNLRTWAELASTLQKYNMNNDLDMIAPMVTPEESEILDMYQTDLYTYMDELFANLLSGVYSIDDYETYKEELYMYGLQEVLDVQQARYDRIVR